MTKALLFTLVRAVIAYAFAWGASAQPQIASPSPSLRPPTIRMSDASAQPVVIRSVDIDTEIVGRDVRSRVEIRIANPNPRVLEGELQFPLLDGQVVSGFALDINGQLREAVAIPKARGQEIFEDIRRRNVDPALLEATAANQYKLRVYPIPANGERRVVLTISEQLTAMGGRAQWRFPIAYSNELERIRMTATAVGARSSELNVQRGPREAMLKDSPKGARFEFERTRWTNPIPDNALVHLDVAARSRELVTFGETNGQRYFVATIPFADEPTRRAEPNHVAIIWDASGSAKDQRQLVSVLDEFFNGLRKPAQITLLVVRNKIDLAQTFPSALGAWDAATKIIREQVNDGSSNFDRLPIPNDVDLAILVSDGLTTDGERNIGYRSRAPLIVLNAATVADTPRLTRLAEANGGRYIDASGSKPNDVAASMRREGWRIESADSAEAEKLAMPSTRVQDGELRVAGMLRGDSAMVTLRLRHPVKGERIVTKKIVDDTAAQRAMRNPPNRWPGQLWATWQIAMLAAEPHIHENAMQRIASEHGVVGPKSSLIVLETADDYARYDVPAPPDLREAVARLGVNKRANEQVTQSAHIERMVREFGERQRWWERSFPKDAPMKVADKKDAAAGVAVGASGAVAPAESRPQRADADANVARRAPAAPPSPVAAAPTSAPAASSAEQRFASRDEPARLARAKSVVPEPANARDATIALQAWSPDAPYLHRLRNAEERDMYRVYLDLRDENASSSAFYLDVASLFFERRQDDSALRILSNLAEMNLENRQLLRLYGYRLNEAKRFALAIPVFARVATLAPNEPQSWRDLGLAYADNGNTQKAVDMLWETVSRPWHQRFAGVNMIALAEMNALIAKTKSVDTKRIDPRLIRNLPLGLRVVMAWDTDDTDIDLWVTDPNGERSFYGKRLSHQGAAMSPDATGGYGPEEFALREPKAGKYLVQAQFFGHRQQVVSNGTTVMVRVTTGFATPQAKDEWMTLRLTKGQETARIGEIDVR
jgi:Ca-activated chloride channel homolog